MTLIALLLALLPFVLLLGINNYQDGAQVVFEISTIGAPQNAVLNVRSSNLDFTSITHLVMGTIHKGLAARIGGALDFQSTITAVFDLDTPPWLAPPLVLPNARGLLLYGLQAIPIGAAGAIGIQLPFIIPKVHYEQAVDKEIIYSFDIQMNILAGNLAYGVQAA